MKILPCDLCDQAFPAETFEEWMQAMMPHYMTEHAAVMEANKNKTKEEHDKWMEVNQARFDAA